MTEWNVDLTSFDLGSVDAREDDLLLAVSGTQEQESTSASELGDYELVYLQNMYQETFDQPFKRTDAELLDTELAKGECLPCIQPDSPADDSAWASSISTPAHQSPEMSKESSPNPMDEEVASKEKKKDRKRKASGGPEKSGSDGSSVTSGCSNSPEPELEQEDDSINMQRIKPEDDPLGLFSRDPLTLTPEEVKLLKKQKRLIKNRESAQLSRHRKKLHQETLESQVLNLEKEKHLLNARLEQLMMENTILKTQLASQGQMPTAPAVNVFDGLRQSKGSLVLAVMFASVLLFTQVDIYRDEKPLQPVVAPSFSSGAVMAAPYVPAGRPRGRVLLSTGSGDEFHTPAPLADKKQLLIITLLDHLVGQLKAPKSLFPRLCMRLTEMGVLDSWDFVDSMNIVRQEYLDVFQAFNSEFSKEDDTKANAHFDAEFIFAKPKSLPKQIDPAPIPLPMNTIPMGTRTHTPSDEETAQLLQGIRGQLSSGLNVMCMSAQLLISDTPANPDGVGARLTRLQKATARLSNVTSADKSSTEAREEAADGGKMTSNTLATMNGALSLVIPRRILDSTKLGSRLPPMETNLLELRCSAYDLNPIGFPPFVGAS